LARKDVLNKGSTAKHFAIDEPKRSGDSLPQAARRASETRQVADPPADDLLSKAPLQLFHENGDIPHASLVALDDLLLPPQIARGGGTIELVAHRIDGGAIVEIAEALPEGFRGPKRVVRPDQVPRREGGSGWTSPRK